MGRSTSVYFFCLAMDPIFVVLNQIPRVFVVAGYVDDTTDSWPPRRLYMGRRSFQKYQEMAISWNSHGRAQLLASRLLQPRLSQRTSLHKVDEVWRHVTPIHEEGQATCSAALQRVPSYARHFVLRHGDHCIQSPLRLFRDYHRKGTHCSAA